MKNIILLLFASSLMLDLHAQHDLPIVSEVELGSDSTFFVTVDETATPVGGMAAFYNFIMTNLQYPVEARRLGIEGKVFVEFVVEKDGTLTNSNIIKGIGAGCDEEALRIIRLAPKWEPGKLKGEPVRQRMVMPFNFKLGQSPKK